MAEIKLSETANHHMIIQLRTHLSGFKADSVSRLYITSSRLEVEQTFLDKMSGVGL